MTSKSFPFRAIMRERSRSLIMSLHTPVGEHMKLRLNVLTLTGLRSNTDSFQSAAGKLALTVLRNRNHPQRRCHRSAAQTFSCAHDNGGGAGTFDTGLSEMDSRGARTYGTDRQPCRLKFSAGGKTIPWRRDDVDMYAFHLEVPAGVRELEVATGFFCHHFCRRLYGRRLDDFAPRDRLPGISCCCTPKVPTLVTLLSSESHSPSGLEIRHVASSRWSVGKQS